tara:strand:- start:13265 stop:13444 length:180 start_codon:yes stop_codon:yes gene_type:complete
VVYNKLYLKFDDFRKSVIDFLENKIWLNNEFENMLTMIFKLLKQTFRVSICNEHIFAAS